LLAVTHYSAVIVTDKHPLFVTGLRMAAIFVLTFTKLRDWRIPTSYARALEWAWPVSAGKNNMLLR